MKKYLYKDLYELEAYHWWHIAKRSLIAKYLKGLKYTDKILDVGCGTGENLIYFSMTSEMYGIDNSKDAIEYCKTRKLKNIFLKSLYDTGFKTQTFDAVFMLDVLEHVSEHKALREVKRILKTNGKIYLTVPAYKALWSRWDVVHGHKRRYTITDLRNVLEKEGFNVKKITYVYSFLVVPVFITRLIKSKLPFRNYSSDFKINTPIVNSFMLKVARLEQRLADYIKIPFGTTVFCIAEKI